MEMVKTLVIIGLMATLALMLIDCSGIAGDGPLFQPPVSGGTRG